MSIRKFAFAALSLAAQLALVQASDDLTFLNPDFEEDLKGWAEPQNASGAFVAIPEAAHRGGLGLQANSSSGNRGLQLASRKIAVEPNTAYRIDFYARNQQGSGAALYLKFYGRDRKQTGDAFLLRLIPKDAREWREFFLAAISPADAAFVAVEIRIFAGSSVTAHFDDIAIKKASTEEAEEFHTDYKGQ